MRVYAPEFLSQHYLFPLEDVAWWQASVELGFGEMACVGPWIFPDTTQAVITEMQGNCINVGEYQNREVGSGG